MTLNVGDLRQRQSLPLEAKINMTKRRIREWYEHWNGQVYVGFSGGKDSTALLHIVREMYPDVPAVFADTGLEFPEIKAFVMQTENVETIRPEKSFKQVLDEEGYPIISKKVARMLRDLQNPSNNNVHSRKLYLDGIKQDGSKTKCFKLPDKYRRLIAAPFKISDKCCSIMKKQPFKNYEKRTKRKKIIGTMASDSKQREVIYLKQGCNTFEGALGCKPMSFWLAQDVWDYIKRFKIPYSSIYDMGYHRTGCIFCMFGVHLEKHPNRFELMKTTHPQLHKYCMNQLGMRKVLNTINVQGLQEQSVFTDFG
jgi:3'-phosphoadenosine 5'-phosphosulfate sulfotransferase (PAPS reductase)/FAD synthetase